MPFTHRTKEESLEEIKNLVQTFSRNYKSYTSKDYDEANTRTDFIDKFFEALNWDVRNDGAKAERFREVVREDKVKIADQTKAPDYSFRIGGQKIFFVEAKKPSVNIKDDEAPAFQVRRYAYTAKLPLSILTDFEEFAVYDTKIKPAQKDNASVARIKYIRYDDYEKEFDFLWNTFSKQAVENGSFDNYAEEAGGKKGTGEIDSALLDLIETWRLSLAKNIALRNESLSLRNLNAAVQKIIDRIIFLRIAEDKEMENYGTLQNAAKQADIYGSLKKIFFDADKKYNSGIFKNESWINALLIDDKILKEIIDELYYPKCPYVWAALPVEILGNIYEKFLGSEITFKNIKGGHTATVEQKPEIKKAGGVFYTPRYIVEYIVSQTLGKKLEGLTTAQADKITVLDPACGSGSFLVGAYKYLLNWYLEQYTKSEPAAKNALKENKIAETTRGLSLSVEEKKRILTGHIFGVDIDSQAVEVTKLSLFLQMLEGEGKELHGTQSDLFRSSDLTILPDMSANIRCGNSLIASDFYANAQGTLFDDEAMIKVNAFDWSEAFRQVGEVSPSLPSQVAPRIAPASSADSLRFVGLSATPSAGSNAARNARFDVVIGNPPYVFARESKEKGMDENEKNYYYSHYSVAKYQINLYHLFIEKASTLLKEDGFFSFIIPNNWLTINSNKDLRQFVLTKSNVQILNFKYKVFAGAEVDTAILVFENNGKNQKVRLLQSEKIGEIVSIHECESSIFLNEKDSVINIDAFTNKSFSPLLQKIESSGKTIADFADVKCGIKAYQIGKGKPAQTKATKESRKFHSKIQENENYYKYIDGIDVKRYSLSWENREFIKYGKHLAEPRTNWNLFSTPRILVRQIPSKPPYCINAVFTDEVIINDLNSMNIIDIQCEPLFMLAVLNSRLISFWFEHKFGKLSRGLFPQFKINELKRFPIPAATKEQQTQFASLADAQIAAHEGLAAAVSEEDKRIARQRINALDAQINALVYKLYGLTDEEIRVVEAK